MKNIFKRIWNLFFGKKKVEREPWMTNRVIEIAKQSVEDFKKAEIPKKPRTQLFNKQQLPGKIYNIGKPHFRIKKKLGMTHPEKLRYEITQL